MRTLGSMKLRAFVIAVLAVIVLAAPGYSWTGYRHGGSGGDYHHGYHHGHGQQYGHGYHHGYRHHGYGGWRGSYWGGYYPYRYRSYYYAPSVSLGFPYPWYAPGFSFYIGP